jgi:hypothetical protein
MSFKHCYLNYLYAYYINNFKNKNKKKINNTNSVKEILVNKTKMKPWFFKLLSSVELQYIVDFLLDDEEQLEIFLKILMRRLRRRYKKFLLQILEEELEQELKQGLGKK